MFLRLSDGRIISLNSELKTHKYDIVIATYSLHHLNDREKEIFIKDSIFPVLNDKGILYVGDIAFKTRKKMENYRIKNIDAWDNDEIYWVYDEIKSIFSNSSFEEYSECAGLIKIWGN